MTRTTTYQNLIVWQKSMELVKLCYAILAKLPAHEKYALGGQITRSAVSIPSNIAEGYRRHSRKEYIQFCGVAAGSAAELETQLLIVQEVYSSIVKDIDQAIDLVSEVQKILYSLIEGLKRNPKPLTLHATR